MKIRFIFFCIILFFVGLGLKAQYTPKGISYQAVARDNLGNELKNKEVEVRLSIIPSDAGNTPEYTEVHNVTTDKYGLFTLIIGQGSYVTGTVTEFSNIDWGSGVHFLKVEADFGTGLKNMGTTQFLAVPYAMYAGSAANSPDSDDNQNLSYDPVKKELSLENGGKVDLSGLYEDADADPLNEIQDLSYSNHTLSLSKANQVTISVDDADADPINEIQSLSLDGYKLSISQGNAVTLTDRFEDADHDSLNEIQDLYLNEISNNLIITKNTTATPISLQKYLDNKDEQKLFTNGDSIWIDRGNTIALNDPSKTNEIQTLSHPGDSIALSLNGGKVFDRYDDADNNPNNELQSIALSGDILSITKDPASSPVNLSKYLDNSDDQNLSKSGYELSIENGNTVNLRPEIIAFRALRNLDNSKILYAGDSLLLAFPIEKFDLTSNYDNSNGKFVVPANGEGLYHFDLIYQYSTGQSLRIFVNGSFYEQVMNTGNYVFIMYLYPGDYIEIQLKSSGVSNPQAGAFSGYRIH